mmetsp:Transcript_869/g.771  ORF Transcript_869/g.771 Transcript_869/m.771 type:complete len:213 (+) Transcript_869:725-1363(+)
MIQNQILVDSTGMQSNWTEEEDSLNSEETLIECTTNNSTEDEGPLELNTESSEFNASTFFMGFYGGLEQKDMSDDVAKCMPAQMKISAAVQKVVADIMQKTEAGLEQALKDGKKVLEAYDASLATCAAMNSDINEFQRDITTIIKNIGSLPTHKEAFMANILAHETKLRADVESLEQAVHLQDSLTLGKDLGEILRLSLLNLDGEKDDFLTI